MSNKIEDIEFGDSYVLGWSYKNYTFNLFTELLLTSNHPKWEKFDVKHEYGCYKLAIFKFYGISFISGVDESIYIPKWNNELEEYEAYSEFDAVKIENHTANFNLEKNNIKIEFTFLDLEILDLSKFLHL